MRTTVLGAIASCAALAVASAAQAATISHVWDFTTYPGGFSQFQEHYVSAFDSSLGTLTRVELSMVVDVDLTITWANASRPGIEILGFWRSQGDTFAHAYPEPEAAPFGVGTGNLGEIFLYQRPGGHAGTLTGSGHFEATGYSDLASVTDLDNWIDADRVRMTYVEDYLAIWDLAESVDFAVAGSAVNRMTLSYIYSPAVPEPATWALMILGFGAVGAISRQSRSRRARA